MGNFSGSCSSSSWVEALLDQGQGPTAVIEEGGIVLAGWFGGEPFFGFDGIE